MYFEMVAAKNMATHKFYILISSFVIITIRSFWFYNVISDAFKRITNESDFYNKYAQQKILGQINFWI